MSYEKALRLSEMQRAARECARGHYYKESVSSYMRDSLCKNQRLAKEIRSGRYRTSNYYIFTIAEPKKRIICATRFRDRIFQKSICNNGVRNDLLGSLIYDNGACQRNKGVDFAIDRTITFLQKFYREHGSNNGEYIHLDIRGYFPNTPHAVSKNAARRHIKDPDEAEFVCRLIDGFPDFRDEEVIRKDPFGKRGTILGSEISQHIQLLIPSHIDHAIKEKFRVKYYIRFNDDMILISDNGEKLKEAEEYIRSEYAKLGLQIVTKNARSKLNRGISFLKRRIILTDTGKVIVKADPKKFGRERRRLRKLKEKLDKGEMTMEDIAAHYQSARSTLARCDEKVRVRSLDRFYKELFGVSPPEQKKKRGKKNAYCKSKSECRKRRGKAGKAGGGKREA